VEALGEHAKDEAVVARAHVHLRRERVLSSGIAALGVMLPPLLSWLDASELGTLPTKFDLAGLASTTGLRVTCTLALVVLVALHFRAASWQWLGVRVPSARRVVAVGALGMITTLIWFGEPLAALSQGILTALGMECAELLVLAWSPVPRLDAPEPHRAR
jgi:hypothetical protein